MKGAVFTAKLSLQKQQELTIEEEKRLAALEEKKKNEEEKRIYGTTLAKLRERQAKKELVEKRAEDEKRAKEEEKNKKENEKKDIEEAYNRAFRKFEVSTPIDIIDFDDYFYDITLLNDYPSVYNEVTEKQRKEKNASLEPELHILDDETSLKTKVFKQIASDSKKPNIDKEIKTIKDYFFTHTPVYNLYVCSCCGKPLPIDKFYYSHSLLNANRIDTAGFMHLSWCKDCCEKLFNYYYIVKTNKEVVKTIQMFCASTNIYWDFDILKKAVDSCNNQESHMTSVVSNYIKFLNYSSNYMKTYWDSSFVSEKEHSNIEAEKLAENISLKKIEEKAIKNEDKEELKLEEVIPAGWKTADIKNRNKIIKMVGYDPFEYIEDPVDRKQVQCDFLNILDFGMENDYTKLQAAIQVVSSFYRIRCLDKRMALRTKEKASSAELKDIATLKAKELDAITSFARDNGFSERYAQSKAKGENTLSGIMNKMSNNQYEKAILNAYDIKTSESMKEIAKMSIEAIFEQLSLGEGDFYKICQDQLKELETLRSDLEDTKEDLRQANIKNAKLRIKIDAIKRGEELEEDWE